MDLQSLMQARKIISSQGHYSVSARLAYKMMKFMKASDDEDAFYNSQLNTIIEKYGERNDNNEFVRDDNGNIFIQKDKINECQNEINTLCKTEVEKPFSIFTIEDLEELKLSLNEMYVLDEFIK